MDSTYLAAFFKDSFFVNCYLSMVFESPIRAVILTSLKDYLVLEGSWTNEHVVERLISVFRTASKSTDVLLLTDLLMMTSDVVRHVPFYSRVLGPVVSEICLCCLQLSKSDTSREFILLLFDSIATV
jgi:hypothetical protein